MANRGEIETFFSHIGPVEWVRQNLAGEGVSVSPGEIDCFITDSRGQRPISETAMQALQHFHNLATERITFPVTPRPILEDVIRPSFLQRALGLLLFLHSLQKPLHLPQIKFKAIKVSLRRERKVIKSISTAF